MVYVTVMSIASIAIIVSVGFDETLIKLFHTIRFNKRYIVSNFLKLIFV